MFCGFVSLMCTRVTRLMVVSREHTLRTTALGEGHLCGKVTHLCVKDEGAHLSIMARSLLSTKTRSPAQYQAEVPSLLTMGFCCSTVRSRSPCSQNSAATSRATCSRQTPSMESGPSPSPPTPAPIPLGFPAQQIHPTPALPSHSMSSQGIATSCQRMMEQWAASAARESKLHSLLSPGMGFSSLRTGGVHTLLCTSQGLVMAERSQAVIIMALHTRTPSISLEAGSAVYLVDSIYLSFFCPY